jgi:ATP-dependent helicase/nuclease subunit B
MDDKRLTLILGRAGTGKTTRIMEEIRRLGESGERGLWLLVPEQFSHGAERQLCRVCGDSLSLYGEVVTFTGLCSRVFAETGAGAGEFLGEGALILAMWRALESVRPRLTAYGGLSRSTDFAERLLAAAHEFKSSRITPAALEETAASASDALRGKLTDLSLIMGAYEGLTRGERDPADRLSLLAELIPEYGALEGGRVYIDGFCDFTAQEIAVVRALLDKCGRVAVGLTCGGLSEGEEVFELPRSAADRLMRAARDVGARCDTVNLSVSERDARSPALRHMERWLFAPRAVPFEGESGGVALRRAAAPYAECEAAAAQALRLARCGYRWRDIAVVARAADSYVPLCESVFERYGIPVFAGGRADVLQKPPAALIIAALETVTGGWEYSRIFRYLKTGLTDITPEECCLLENYVLKWNIKGGRDMWTRAAPWKMPAAGRGTARDDDGGRTARIDDIRARVAAPLDELWAAVEGAPECGAKLKGLLAFLERIGLPGRLTERAAEFTRRGDMRAASEYARLWEIINEVCGQFERMLGGVAADGIEFTRLFALAVSRYDISVIPVSLDRVMLGDMAKGRRRDVKCLIVLGASDGELPRAAERPGVLSDSERSEMAALGADTGNTASARYAREINMIYSSLTLPTLELFVTYPGDGGAAPSSVITRLSEMFGAPIEESEAPERLSEAPVPCSELAAMADAFPRSAIAAAARAYFNPDPGAASGAEAALERLSRARAVELYGGSPSLSASRADRFNTCKFAFFMESGLRARPRVREELDAPAAGTFLHYILEKTAREIAGTVGFESVSARECAQLAAKYADEYAQRELGGFDDRSGRFRYMYRRLAADAARIAADTAGELSRSEFKPCEFEYRFSECVQKDGASFRLTGLIDRMDIWESDGVRYVRVIDYKTGKKSFDLTDVYYGVNAQMLIYLSALRKRGGRAEGAAPAGILYVPARDEILPAGRDISAEELSRLRERELRRCGLLLDRADVLDAMETGGANVYLPVERSALGEYSGDSLIPPGRFERLLEHADGILEGVAARMADGEMAPDPYTADGRSSACDYCDYRSACRFGESGGEMRFLRRLGPGEFWEMLEAGR